MKLRLRHNQRFVVGSTSFEMAEGAIVELKQFDAINNKMLIDFGDGVIDWVSRNVVRVNFDKATAQ